MLTKKEKNPDKEKIKSIVTKILQNKSNKYSRKKQEQIYYKEIGSSNTQRRNKCQKQKQKQMLKEETNAQRIMKNKRVKKKQIHKE